MCGDDHFTKEFPRHEEIDKFLKNNPTPAALTDPFHSQQKLVDHTSLHGTSSSTEEIRMMFAEIIALTTRNQTYNKPNENKYEGGSSKNTPPINPSPPPPSNGPLTINKPISDTILRPPKSTIHKKKLILVLKLLNFKMLLNIYPKHLVLCPCWRYS